MKKWLILTLFLLLQWQTAMAANVLELDIPEDRAVLVMEEDSGQVLYTQNEDEKMYPASLTKLMTALVVTQENDLDESFIPGAEMNMISSQSSRAYLIQGESITIKDALAGLLLPSGSDAAMALAVHTGRKHQGDETLSEEDALDVFIQLMNEKAMELGMENSHFVNPHGLHDPMHYTTAGDLMILARTVLEEPFISQLVSQAFYETEDEKYTFSSTNVYLHTRLDDVLYLYQTGSNPQYRSDVTGVKTGYTSQAGRCLIFRAHSQDKSLLGIVLHSDMPEIYDEGIEIMDQVFDDLDWIPEPAEGTWENTVSLDGVLFLPGSTLDLEEEWTLSHLVQNDQISNISYEMIVTSEKLRMVDGGTYRLVQSLEDGEAVGELQVLVDGEAMGSVQVSVVEGRSVLTGYLPLAAIAVVLLVVAMGVSIRIRSRNGMRL